MIKKIILPANLKKYGAALLSAVVFICIGFGASCLKKQNLEEDYMGEAVPPEVIAEALGDAFGSLDYNQIKKNEVSDIILTQSMQDGAPQSLVQQDVTILEVNNQPSYLQIKSYAKLTNYSSTGNSTDIRDWDQTFNKYGGFAFSLNQGVKEASTNDLEAPLFMFQLIQNIALMSCYDGDSHPETCHNLQVTEIDYKVPPAAAGQHDCADLYNCFIKAKRIEFDLLQKYNVGEDGKARRVHYDLVISQNVPYTARVLQFCTRALYEIEGLEQKVLADLCYKVNKYTYGQ